MLHLHMHYWVIALDGCKSQGADVMWPFRFIRSHCLSFDFDHLLNQVREDISFHEYLLSLSLSLESWLILGGYQDHSFSILPYAN